MRKKFKVGDRVRFVKSGDEKIDKINSRQLFIGLYGTILEDKGRTADGDPIYRLALDTGGICDGFTDEGELKKTTKKAKKTKYLLRFDMEEDPVEEWATFSEIEDRIRIIKKEGAHNFVVYELGKKFSVDIEEIEEVVTIS